MANFRIEYDSPGIRHTTAFIGFDPRFIAYGRDNDIHGWERKPPCLL
jgi:hypothetical protein